MQTTFKNNLAAYGAGLIFASGLAISGMTQPTKVIGFLRWGEGWDPSLALVMAGAIAVFGLAYHLWLKKKLRPFLAPSFSIPSKRKIDGRLLLGASLFGIGWGWAGYCPGPALVAAASLDKPVLIFVLSMMSGMLLHHFYERWRQHAASRQRTATSPLIDSH